jgi:hypothetical protein
VPAYRIYELHARAPVVRPARVLIRENDTDVIRMVEPPADGHDVEIMEGARVVARLRHHTEVAQPRRRSSTNGVSDKSRITDDGAGAGHIKLSCLPGLIAERRSNSSSGEVIMSPSQRPRACASPRHRASPGRRDRVPPAR